MNGNDKTIVVGFTSKVGSLICNFPLLTVLGLFGVLFAIFLALGESHAAIGRGIIAILLIFGFMRLLGQLLTKKWCYKIVIDKKYNRLCFYRLFNQGVITLALKDIAVKIGAYCYICIADQEFILHVAFIHEFVSYLPSNTRIEYVGAIGKYKGKEWNRTGRPLLAGTADLDLESTVS